MYHDEEQNNQNHLSCMIQPYSAIPWDGRGGGGGGGGEEGEGLILCMGLGVMFVLP